MAKSIRLELVTPEKAALSETAEHVALPAFEGEMGVLPGHEPYMVQLVPGLVRARTGSEQKVFAVSGGFAEITADKVAIFAETAEMDEEIDLERAKQAAERAKAESRRKDIDPMTLAQAEAALARAQVRMKVAERMRRKPSRPKR